MNQELLSVVNNINVDSESVAQLPENIFIANAIKLLSSKHILSSDK